MLKKRYIVLCNFDSFVDKYKYNEGQSKFFWSDNTTGKVIFVPFNFFIFTKIKQFYFIVSQ